MSVMGNENEKWTKVVSGSKELRYRALNVNCPLIVYTDLDTSWLWPDGMKVGKAKRGGYSKFRYLQFNNFAILTLFRA
jgi:hypothetical protein